MEDKKFDILKTEFLLTQQQMDKYDQLSMTIKAWAVTLWVAASGWAFQSGKKEMFLLSVVLICAFWFFDGINKTFRTNYKKRRDKIAALLQNEFQGKPLPSEESAPKLPPYSLRGTLANSFLLHIALPYVIFLFLSLLFFFLK